MDEHHCLFLEFHLFVYCVFVDGDVIYFIYILRSITFFNHYLAKLVQHRIWLM